MIGILVVTHGNLGKELLKSAELIVGKQERTMALGLFPGDNIEELKDNILKTIEILDEGDGVLIFIDFYGGSPANATIISSKDLGENVKVEYITGVNMPMIIEALTMRKIYNLSSLKEHCIERGVCGIKDLRKLYF
ncbi:PTS system, mannose-specific IIA component [Thermoanaerobacter thermohydrosulfuricus]|jgi:PTS system mannose-specific IIA component|uniref:PTS system fructose subfamily IIA component n=3 Tax=Thermoanaerobacter TaxID=1754 RepID=G2MXR3_9THEO|nr:MULTISPECIES: PTS sugar transporter subunit IIA [Thermoanaerobacter]EGD52636.1 PTS system fructose subfamily IIA component [Thermoanaerobacter ethanolicus JW 200]MDI3310413.1 PTS sugar transporter subunit IIA [Thermoanaerobacterium sp.]MDK2814283.1 mannose system component [Thermoanaerobacter sp.]AEM79293.1 PTS system fructose subfamily IIA component [Thermoanaerobacter wiegelii Rt8.B1]EMT38057.1 Phosphotransferase system, mannose/fructose- specific component IIA [Thermoanaerobacter thermoh